jgi:DNA-directed RNA polymerase specialized sigma24 family protein
VSSVDDFEAFMAAHERRLRQALTATFGIDLGREAAADAFAYAWEHWDRVAGMANPAGYLFVVGRDRQRRRFRIPQRKPVFDIGADYAEPWCEPALAAQMAGLSDRERIAVMLVNGYQWSLAEVAELWGVSKSTVQTHAERGIAKLRAGMGVTA